MLRIVLIGSAGLLGTLCRYWLSGVVGRRWGGAFPAGTLVVNLLGCLLAGLLFYAFEERYEVGETARAALFVGLLGGFTTFSSYGLQTFALLRGGELLYAAANVLASNLLGLLSVGGGYWLGRLLGGAAR